MKRYSLIPTYPDTKISFTESLGVNLLTVIQLTDYELYSSPVGSQWIKNMSKNLSETVKADLQILRAVFAHGVILRDYFIKHENNLSLNWAEFIAWWEDLNDDAMLDLIIYGIRENFDYYYNYLPKMPLVEEMLEEVNLDQAELKNDENRKKALSALLQSWSVENIDEIVPIFMDLHEVKERTISLIKGFWEIGFEQLWEEKKKFIINWMTLKENETTKAGTNEEAIFNITGLYPDVEEREAINQATHLTFIPVVEMGRLLSYTEIENHIYLMFDPSLNNEAIKRSELNVIDSHLAFEGLGDATRLQIIHLLSEQSEMYAQEIVKELNMKQSTISRHLNQLQQANLVKVRQEGNTKYFSINQEEIIKVINILNAFIN
mgnify:FL=1